jgi:uncharacterized protein YacL
LFGGLGSISLSVVKLAYLSSFIFMLSEISVPILTKIITKSSSTISEINEKNMGTRSNLSFIESMISLCMMYMVYAQVGAFLTVPIPFAIYTLVNVLGFSYAMYKSIKSTKFETYEDMAKKKKWKNPQPYARVENISQSEVLNTLLFITMLRENLINSTNDYDEKEKFLESSEDFSR